MSGTGDGVHYSIGEVLAELQTDFPDVTVSKIRFLESQGLIDPERTPSGYRKFRAGDVERLRWILGEQRDRYMPLKVIKERLEAHDPAAGPLPAPSAPPADGPPAAAPADPAPEPAPALSPPPAPAPAPSPPPAPAPAPPATAAPAPEPPPAPGPAPSAAPAPDPAPPPAAVPPRRRTRELTLPLVLDGEPADGDDGPDSFDRVALARAAGVTEAVLDELERYGVITPFHDDGIRAFFDRDALACVQAATVLARHGIQPRHLKMYVHFTEREAALFQQVLAPYLRQRNPVSRAKVDETLAELVTEARVLRGALLRRAVDQALGD
jgi:DNA-binding transcriptional MerR regulator